MTDHGRHSGNGQSPPPRAPSVYGADGVTIIGMIGVVREAAANRGATLSLFGGGINPGAEVPAGVDPDYILDFARTHEDAGFDLVLTGYSSSTPDGFEVAGYAAAHTTRLGYLIAHRPGFVAPTLAARKAATLDQLTGGRIALHIITGGNDREQRQDGDWLEHDARYRRTNPGYAGMPITGGMAKPTQKGQDPARYPGHVLHRGRPPAGRSLDRIAPPYRGAKMRRVRRPGPAFLPAARPMAGVPCRPPLPITAQRHRRQGFYRGNANDGSTQSARPFSTSCNHGLRPMGFPAGWSFPATPVP